MLVKLVDNNVGYTISFQIDDDPGSFLIIRFVIYVCNAFDYFFIYQFTDPVGQCVPVDLVRYFGNDDLFTSAWLGIHVQLATNDPAAAAKMHGCFYSFHSVNDTTGWKIRGLYMLHQFFHSDCPITDKGNTSIDHF